VPPYENVTGDPIDWSQTETTETGLHKPGHVVAFSLDCTSGMIRVETLGLQFDFREVSPRALAVHKPREACAERGFTAAF
jgi:hypothetical protein